MRLRQHQLDAYDLAGELLQGRRIRYALHWVTPGGGKSLLPVIYAHRLIPGRIDRICWLVPRDSLRLQGAQAFTDEQGRALLGHTLMIRESYGLEYDPARGTDGYITTYQSVTEAPSLHAQEFERARYALFLDEPHHCALGNDRRWYEATDPLVQRASLVFLMTGSLDRGDGERIGWLDYLQDRGDGSWRVNLTSREECPVIEYRRAEALGEEAIIQAKLAETDGRGDWVSAAGELRRVARFDEVGESEDEKRGLVHVALDEKFAFALLMYGAAEWRASLEQHPHNQLLIVAHGQTRAAEYTDFLKHHFRIRCGLAVTNEGPQAARTIEQFRTRRLPALATVGMAYEGLDAPGISHIVALTQIRSRPWIEQMVGRAVRVDALRMDPVGDRRALIYAPKDPLMMETMAAITAEQVEPVREREPGGLRGPRAFEDRNRGNIVVLDSAMTEVMLRELFRYGRTPAQREQRLRDRIEASTRRIDFRLDRNPGATNAQLKRAFKNKSREEMDFQELMAVWAWINRHYGDLA